MLVPKGLNNMILQLFALVVRDTKIVSRNVNCEYEYE